MNYVDHHNLMAGRDGLVALTVPGNPRNTPQDRRYGCSIALEKTVAALEKTFAALSYTGFRHKAACIRVIHDCGGATAWRNGLAQRLGATAWRDA
jgi:hypothetical protein